MPDHDTTLEILEQAERDVTRCTVCTEPTVLQAHADGSIWLECSTLADADQRGGLRRLATLAVPHFRREVVPAD
jgi:ssDNA-binding Zn-finger/Zn-ribbon topoisomerase 1